MKSPLVRFLVAAGVVCWLAAPSMTFPQNLLVETDQSGKSRSFGWLPYAFKTQELDWGVGVGGVYNGDLQPQMSILGTIAGTTNKSAIVSGAILNYLLPGTERLFFDGFVLGAHYTDARVYAGNRNVSSRFGTRAGSNESSEDDFLTGVSNDSQIEMTLKYPLPIGEGRDTPISIYELDRGLRVGGPNAGDVWNPLVSGKTTLALKYFYRHRSIDSDPTDARDVLFYRTNGLQLSLLHENMDFPRNPSSGSRQKLVVSQDFGWGDSTASWTAMQFDLSKYVDLKASQGFRQRVLAMNFWTSHSPSWRPSANDPQQIEHRPPDYRGSALGGNDRMRAYPQGRFNDRSAVYYTLELRLTPNWNPLRDLPLIRNLKIDWLQFVPFVEAGRTSPSYDAQMFTKDLRYDYGIDLRLMALKTVVRMGIAKSNEGTTITAMYAQPFGR